jgi:hypothetical protein
MGDMLTQQSQKTVISGLHTAALAQTALTNRNEFALVR